MKTDKFEKNIRRKLESLSPEFQEKDWTSMQNYLQAQSPPTFWQQYRGWAGYAAAASVVLLSGILYAFQLQKNLELTQEVQSLEKQVKAIQQSPPVRIVDTVYIVRQEPYLSPQPRALPPYESAGPLPKDPIRIAKVEQDSATEPAISLSETGITKIPETTMTPPLKTEEYTSQSNTASPEATSANSTDYLAAVKEIESVGQRAIVDPANRTFRMEYALRSKLTPNRVKMALAPSRQESTAPAPSDKSIRLAKTSQPEQALSGKQVEKTENTIPKLPIKQPYRFGAGFGFEGSSQVTSAVAEVQITKQFSISTGVSWLKSKPLNFINEKVFKEKNKMDFKKEHPNKIPYTFELFNIRMRPNVVQIPLTVAFRKNIAKDLHYYINSGVQFTVSGRDKFEFDMLAPGPNYSNEYYRNGFSNNKKLPLVNNMNVGVGMEKSWHPFIIQVEGYVFHYFTPLSPLNSNTGPGIKLKLLYQIGKDA
ncbi:hypothetical protein CLV98_102182 [Dyadobacter jejuensis]|uniref:Uncharacterized protein n=1 Tax=Dyadobacter jejuensis TaxID=1082580 RepID=A0A316AQ11_9BACT|nr:hypothetical protein [Dyadobacter jejuensis]PWJ59349.1 hypothetical protein CLV98_102182 [Dyadobacter jejuensis]